MIINNSRRFLFIHTPKAAGTSVTRELSRFTTFRDIEVGGTKYGEKLQDSYSARFDLRKHSTAEAIRTKAGPDMWRNFFVFAFVRDPYARAYSLYRFLQKWRDGPHHAAAAEVTFEEFITSDAVYRGDIEIAKPQAHWLSNRRGELLPGIDFIGRLEQFDQDFSFILSTISRRPIAFKSVSKANVSTHSGEWKSAMTFDAQAAIEEIYAADFTLFGYQTCMVRKDDMAA
ncbi:MAG: sulfotransferase family 2 domain-containing protein [Pikeienuella sp.]